MSDPGCDNCVEYTLDCVCDDESITTISEFPPELIKFFKCQMIPKKIPIMTETGIRLVCKKRCYESKT